MTNSIPYGYKPSPHGPIPQTRSISEFGDFAKLEKKKYQPNLKESKKCLELEHLNQTTGNINGRTSSAEQKSTKNVFKKGQVLFGKLRPYLRKYRLAEFDGVCSSEIRVLNKKNEKCTNSYLYNLIQTHTFIQVANVTSGSKMPRADWNYVSTFPFPLPPLPEQKAIATILSSCDETITQTQQLIEKLELRHKALCQQLLTGKKRVEGFDGEIKYIPIKNFANQLTAKNDSNKELIVLSCTKYNGLVSSLEYFGRKMYSDDLSKYKLVPEGSFAYATNHIEEGSIGYQDQHKNALISPMYTIFKTNDGVNDYYLYYQLKTHRLIHEYNRRMTGSIDRRGGLRRNEFKKIKVFMPTLNEQEAILEILESSRKQILQAEGKLSKLKKTKKGLMQQLLTGKTRVLESYLTE